MPETTTIQVSTTTKKKLRDLKNYPSESFEMLFQRIIVYMKEEDEQVLTNDDLNAIKKSVQQIEDGKYKTLSQLRKKYTKK